MTEVNHDVHATKNKKYSEQEKRAYYTAWLNAGMSQVQFCKEQGLLIDHFYYWHSQFKKQDVIESTKQFSPIVAKTAPSVAEKIVLEMRLPNLGILSITINEDRLISFIQELCCATAVIR